MRIEPDGKPVELSYVDLLGGLKYDITDDPTLDNHTKARAVVHVDALMDILEKYSA